MLVPQGIDTFNIWLLERAPHNLTACWVEGSRNRAGTAWPCCPRKEFPQLLNLGGQVDEGVSFVQVQKKCQLLGDVGDVGDASQTTKTMKYPLDAVKM